MSQNKVTKSNIVELSQDDLNEVNAGGYSFSSASSSSSSSNGVTSGYYSYYQNNNGQISQGTTYF
jgi:hypothetical protein